MKKFLNFLSILLISIGIFFAFDYIQYRIIIANSNEVPQKCYLEQLFGRGYYTSHSINFHKLPFERKRQDYRENIFNNNSMNLPNDNFHQKPSYSEPISENTDDKLNVSYADWINIYKPTGQWKQGKYDNATKMITITRIS